MKPPKHTPEEIRTMDDAITKWLEDAPDYAKARIYQQLHIDGMTLEKAHNILVKAGASTR